MTLVPEFDLIPIPTDAQSVRCLSFLDTILILIIDDCQLLLIDVAQSWSKAQLNVSLTQMSNLRLFKLSEDLFLIAGVKFILYQVVVQPKIRLKLIEEVLAWDYSTH